VFVQNLGGIEFTREQLSQLCYAFTDTSIVQVSATAGATHPWLQTLFSPRLDDMKLSIAFVDHPAYETAPTLFKKIVNQIMRNNRRSVDENKSLEVSSHAVALAHMLLLQPLFKDHPEVTKLIWKQALWWNFVAIRVPVLHSEYSDSSIAAHGVAERIEATQAQTHGAG